MGKPPVRAPAALKTTASQDDRSPLLPPALILPYDNLVMARFLASLCFGAWIACGSRCLAASPAASSLPAVSPSLNVLLEQLTAESFKTREEAGRRLSNEGERIRPALLDAAHHGESPELRCRAEQLLSALPWSLPTDPPEVRQVLTAYRSPNAEARIAAVRNLGALEVLAFDALLRLLAEEPCDDVRWVIVEQLHHFTGDAQRERLRRLATTADDAPLLAAAGWAWMPGDPGKGLRLLGRSADLAAPHALEDAQELLLVLKTLYVRALNVGHYEEAIGRMRQMILYNDRPLSEAMLELLAVHAEDGPQRGFEDDVRLAAGGFYSPEMMYVLGRLYARQNQTLLAAALYRAAGLAGLATQETHLRVAEFLLERRWYDLARIEAEWILATPGSQKQVGDLQAHVFLAHCALAQGEDAEAVESMNAALQILGRIPGGGLNYEHVLRAELDWYALRVAKAKGDLTEMALRIDRLVDPRWTDRAASIDPEFEIDVITSLKTLHRADEAASFFHRLFDDYHRQLDADPNDPDILNNLAWLSARCNERGDEAVAWSAKAIRLAPMNAAYLDTAAETMSRVGRWDEAVKLEGAALKLQPGDRFMISQWVRFRKGGL